MKNFIRNWDLKKHIAAETMFYTSIALIGNALLGNSGNGETKKSSPLAVCRSMPKRQKTFNCALLGCFAVDLIGGYCLIKCLRKIAKI